MLHGVAKALISSRLAEVGMTQRTAPVHVSGLAAFDGAFLCNSATPACPITAIGDHAFDASPERIDRLAHAWASNPVQAI